MNANVELRLTHLSDVEILELENAIEEQGLHAEELLTREPDHVPSGTVGDPGLTTILISAAPHVISVLAGALAVWIVKGRKGKEGSAKTLKISKSGIEFSRVSISEFDVSNSADTLKPLLADLIGGKKGS